MGLSIPNIYRVYIGPAGSLDQYVCAGVAEESSLARQPLLSVFRYYAITAASTAISRLHCHSLEVWQSMTMPKATVATTTREIPSGLMKAFKMASLTEA